MKKIMCVLFSLLIVAMSACMAGCGDKSNEKVKLRWVVMWAEQKDFDMVVKEANKLLAKLMPNTELDLQCLESLPSKWSLWMSSGEPVDLVWSGYSFDVGSEINKKSYMELDDLIEKYAPNLKKERENYEYAYNTITVNDKLYGVPHIQFYAAETARLTIPSELVKYMDEDALLKAAHGSPFATKELFNVIDKYLYASKNAGAWDTDTVSQCLGTMKHICQFVAQRGYDFIGSGEEGAYMCYNPFDEKPQITNFMQTEQFKLMMEYASKWYKDGLISKDVISGNGGSSGGRAGILSAHSTENWFNVDDERGIKHETSNGIDITVYLLDDADNKYQGATTIGSEASYTCIPYTSKHPERAIQFLDLIHSDKGKDLFNMLIYGIEGVHYDKVGKNRVKPYDYTIQGDSNSKYGIANWMLGNLDYAWETPNIPEGQAAYIKNYNTVKRKEQHASPLKGFCVDTSNVTKEISQLTAVFKEYKETLINGVMADYMSYYNEMMNKAKAAGLDKVTAEFQKQADEYAEKNK